MFPLTEYRQILEAVDSLDPIAYGKTRNYGNGAVTRLSPYISRGVISTSFVLKRTLARGYAIEQIQKFADELCWRDYFQLLGIHNTPVLTGQETTIEANAESNALPEAVVQAETGIAILDEGIRTLYTTGYMHNHLRMYTAMLVCNIARTHWFNPSQWMHYHLLDADFASNACSWQWVAGLRNGKKYYATQENINKYFSGTQSKTFLDVSYSEIEHIPVPDVLTKRRTFTATTQLPETAQPKLRSGKPLLVYTFYNLDPLWHANTDADRVLLLEPSFFEKYPVAPQTMEFVLSLAKNIPGLQIVTDEFSALSNLAEASTIISKEHPLTRHFTGITEPRDFIVPEVNKVFSSFFGYKKSIEPYLKRLTGNSLFAEHI